MGSDYVSNSLHVTLMTPFDESEKVDTAELARQVAQTERVDLDLPVVPIINAEAGEIYTLEREELVANVTAAVEVANGPVVAGVVGRTTAEAIAVARDALACGAAALFVLPPYGSADITTSWNAARYPEVVADYLGKVADSVGDVPLIVHPTGPRTPEYGIGWPVETIEAVLDRVPTVAGWKMTYSYEGYRRVARFLRAEAPQVAILPSSAVRYHENLANRQLDGACSGSFCYALEPMLEHIRLWRAGEVDAATKLWQSGLAALHEYVYSDYSRLHIRYKLATWIAGKISSPLMRDPMPAPLPDEVHRLYELMSAAGLANRTPADLD
ncbi:dihydrodipicolinate synthase family protein [Saccharopolyspora sp. K220]|uniref:dihydrodipicolinate synthase family protein n=1 Tax=Saccharopolyspora soli TaxID=2926618 RepID=UPI001F591900|nr:dihydrodipicolinate synthase family protein [Saccharopolyspora soli]MCI2417400.1 dihydrodipicolinate synthase family protein [Saccharopolyspora soli]